MRDLSGVMPELKRAGNSIGGEASEKANARLVGRYAGAKTGWIKHAAMDGGVGWATQSKEAQ